MCKICRGESLVGLEFLDCDYCDDVTEIPAIEGLKELYCQHTNITAIPYIEGLKYLDCNTTNITAIPSIEGLEFLSCSYNTNITEVPCIQGLESLYCQDTNITEVPHVQGLKHLICDNTNITAIPDIEGLRYFSYDDCMWLDKSNTIPVIKLQQWVRRIRRARRLLKIMYELAPIYYAPDAKGGYFAKREIERLFS